MLVVQKGDVVRLKSDDKKMTVEQTYTKNGVRFVHCVWFEGAEAKRDCFVSDCLEKVGVT